MITMLFGQPEPDSPFIAVFHAAIDKNRPLPRPAARYAEGAGNSIFKTHRHPY
jgi:hypothetical protein